MSRIQRALDALTQDSSIRVILDVNPNPVEVKNAADVIAPGEGRAVERLKAQLRDQNVRYFATAGVQTTDDLAAVIGDYALNNLKPGERFILVYDRQPADLQNAIGQIADGFAGIYAP